MSPADVAVRIRSEYREMPGLQLTFAQARVLWQLDAPTCSAVLQLLVDEGFLIGRPDGKFVGAPSRRACVETAPKELTPTPRR